jgi:hypothetical protein
MAKVLAVKISSLLNDQGEQLYRKGPRVEVSRDPEMAETLHAFSGVALDVSVEEGRKPKVVVHRVEDNPRILHIRFTRGRPLIEQTTTFSIGGRSITIEKFVPQSQA